MKRNKCRNARWKGRSGKWVVDKDKLEVRAREIKENAPEKFSVKELAMELHCSNHNSSLVYYKILRGG